MAENISSPDDLTNQLENLTISTSETTTESSEYVYNRLSSLTDVVHHLKNCKNIVTITGAGISTSCGIPDFRSAGGLYSTIRERFPDMTDPTDFFNIRYFDKNPVPFFEMASEIWPDNFEPSITHKFMARLDAEGRLQRNYTQNIDTLEQKAGIKRVIQCHGSFQSATCRKCKVKFEPEEIKDIIMKKTVPKCTKKEGCNGVIKPDITFFGEGLPDEFFECLEEDGNSDVDNVDLILVIGSTMKVGPVNQVPMALDNKRSGKVPIILINCESVCIPLCIPTIKLLGYGDTIISELEHRMDNDFQGKLKMRAGNELDEDVKNEFYEAKPGVFHFEGWRDD